MKNKLACLLFLALFMLSNTAFATNWIYIKDDKGLSGKLYIDTDSIEKKGDTIIFWDDLVIPPQQNAPGVEWMAKWEVKLTTPLQYREIDECKYNPVTKETYDRNQPNNEFSPMDEVFQQEAEIALQYAKDKN